MAFELARSGGQMEALAYEAKVGIDRTARRDLMDLIEGCTGPYPRCQSLGSGMERLRRTLRLPG